MLEEREHEEIVNKKRTGKGNHGDEKAWFSFIYHLSIYLSSIYHLSIYLSIYLSIIIIIIYHLSIFALSQFTKPRHSFFFYKLMIGINLKTSFSSDLQCCLLCYYFLVKLCTCAAYVPI